MQVGFESESGEFKLSSALMIYQSSTGQSFVTKHRVTDDPQTGRPMIRAGTALRDQDYLKLVRGLQKKHRPQLHWEDSRVLTRASDRVVWWSPPQIRSMFFKKSHEGTFTGQGLCPCPGLIFMARKNDLRIFAVKGVERPVLQTELHQAPFFNVWSDGLVCMGTAIAPEAADSQSIDQWESTFFGSNFTHPNINEKNQLTKGVDPRKFWKRMIEKPSQTFRESVLVSLGKTAEVFLKHDVLMQFNR
jgi:PRTRC genetic system protein B